MKIRSFSPRLCLSHALHSLISSCSIPFWVRNERSERRHEVGMESDEMGGGVKKGGVFRSCRSSSLHTPSFSTPPITTIRLSLTPFVHSSPHSFVPRFLVPRGAALGEWIERDVTSGIPRFISRSLRSLFLFPSLPLVPLVVSSALHSFQS